jgi:hypothetical protein
VVGDQEAPPPFRRSGGVVSHPSRPLTRSIKTVRQNISKYNLRFFDIRSRFSEWELFCARRVPDFFLAPLTMGPKKKMRFRNASSPVHETWHVHSPYIHYNIPARPKSTTRPIGPMGPPQGASHSVTVKKVRGPIGPTERAGPMNPGMHTVPHVVLGPTKG